MVVGLSCRRPGEELSTTALDLTAAMREDAQAVQGRLQLQRTQSKELYAEQIRQKKEKRDKSLGEFARHDGVHVDPLLDVLAVSRFLQKRRPSVQPHRSLLFEAPVIVAHVWFLRKTQRSSERTPAKTPPPLPLPRTRREPCSRVRHCVAPRGGVPRCFFSDALVSR